MSFSMGDKILVEAGAFATTRFDKKWFKLDSTITGICAGEWILENGPERGYGIQIRGAWFCVKPPDKVRRYPRLEEKIDEVQDREDRS